MTTLAGYKPNHARLSASLLHAACLFAPVLLNLSCTFYFDTFTLGSPRSAAEEAEAMTEAGEYDKAISLYLRHIDARLGNPYRTPEENPYFYYTLISDLYLKKGEVDKAEHYLVDALERKVNLGLCIDRLRRLGRWHEERGEFEEAFAVLQKHRALDPMLFDLEIDRIHKELIRKEEEAERNRPKAVRFPPK